MKDFWKNESGASAAEYGLILAIVTGGITAAVISLEDAITTAIATAADCIEYGNTGQEGKCTVALDDGN